jgi:hypothetical protein
LHAVCARSTAPLLSVDLRGSDGAQLLHLRVNALELQCKYWPLLVVLN